MQIHDVFHLSCTFSVHMLCIYLFTYLAYQHTDLKLQADGLPATGIDIKFTGEKK